MAPGLAEMFSAAIKQLLKKEGRGGQVLPAERLGIKNVHLSNLLVGRSGWPDSIGARRRPRRLRKDLSYPKKLLLKIFV